MQFKADMDTRSFEKTLSGWEKQQLPFATARSLTMLATKAIKPALRGAMEVNLDEPTPFTLNSLYVQPATKARLTATVGIKNAGQGKATPPSIWLEPQVVGGQRPYKRSELQMQRSGLLPRNMIWVPGAATKLNRYGNIQPSLLTQILSATGALSEVGYLGNRTARSAKRRQKPFEVFVGRPAGGRLPLGVYQRTSRGIKPLLVFVARGQYKVRFPMGRIATDVYEADFAAIFDKCLRDALVLQPFLSAA